MYMCNVQCKYIRRLIGVSKFVVNVVAVRKTGMESKKIKNKIPRQRRAEIFNTRLNVETKTFQAHIPSLPSFYVLRKCNP